MPQRTGGSDGWLDVAEQIAEQSLMTCDYAAVRESTEALQYLREATESRKAKQQAGER